ncbi:MAG TPA: ATP-binding protein [Dongiaceae bacterium]|nr:ATP-binding protein [Dongiaceae bacterium]
MGDLGLCRELLEAVVVNWPGASVTFPLPICENHQQERPLHHADSHRQLKNRRKMLNIIDNILCNQLPKVDEGRSLMSSGRQGNRIRHHVANARAIARELDWLEKAIVRRLEAYSGQGGEAKETILPPPPDLTKRVGPYADLVRRMSLGLSERLILALALAPYLSPERLDPFLLQNAATGRRFTEFGGLTGQAHTGFLPTAETALFLLAGAGGQRRIARDFLCFAKHPLLQRGILVIDRRHPEEPPLSGALRLSTSGLHLLLRGEDSIFSPGPDFPASLLTTPLDWEDLILDAATMQQIEMVGLWIDHASTLMEKWGLARRLKPGYRCLFHGPPGTGKTLTASLLGKRHGLPVYRVDLSQLVSKWIGETEKNIATLFDQADKSNWILFFDEADALFGKRTETRSANDRSANQQIAYLLQRLEGYSGLAILATNQTAHLDEAFARRFQSSIHFPIPNVTARLRLWRENFAARGFLLSSEIDFESIAEQHKLAGGAIINVLRYACLMAVQRNPAMIEPYDLLEGIRLEFHKNGRSLG